jgi:hypothetical protein
LIQKLAWNPADFLHKSKTKKLPEREQKGSPKSGLKKQTERTVGLQPLTGKMLPDSGLENWTLNEAFFNRNPSKVLSQSTTKDCRKLHVLHISLVSTMLVSQRPSCEKSSKKSRHQDSKSTRPTTRSTHPAIEKSRTATKSTNSAI